MATDLIASRLMIRNACKKLEENHPDKTMYCAMAKKFVTDKSWEIVDKAL